MFGTLSIIISYILVILFLLWRYSDENKKWGQSVLILSTPLLIWYSLILFFSLNSMMGYPTNSTMPDDTIIYSYRIVEPTDSECGGMYFWGLPAEKIMDQTFIPRSYRLEYNKELHKQLMQKGSGKGGKILMWRLLDLKNRGAKMDLLLKGKYSAGQNAGNFEMINPAEILTKEEKIELGKQKECDGVCQ